MVEGAPNSPLGRNEKKTLKEKYLPFSYHLRFVEEWQSLRQGSMSVTEYIEKFEEY
ncbi:hypothetical protein PJP07_30070, partial [Mycobacterium kansasii]